MLLTAKLCLRNLLTAAVLMGSIASLAAQTGSPQSAPYEKVIGEVTAISDDGKTLTVKPDTGDAARVALDENTSYMRVPPGEKDLRKATRIALKDITVGDRVYTRSRKSSEAGQVAAVSVILMSKTEIAQNQEKRREEWQRRGAAGKVKAVDDIAKTVTISVQTPSGPHDLIVETDGKTEFRRYAPDSVKFSDAKPGQFGQIASGDGVRVLGDKNDDGTKIHAEQVVSGSFRNLAGTVASVDATSNEVKINDLVTKKPVTIRVNADTNLRKLPAEVAARIARARADNSANAGTPGATEGQQHGEGGPGSRPGFNGPGDPKAAGKQGNTGALADAARVSPQGARPGGASPGSMGPGGGRMGRMDMNQMMDRLPQFAIGDLKPGDAVIVSSTNGSDPSRVTAIAVVAGVEPILAAVPSGRSGQRQSGTGGDMWNLEGVGLPQ